MPDETFLILNTDFGSVINLTLLVLERFSIECRKTKTKVITLANQKGWRQSGKPIKTRSYYT